MSEVRFIDNTTAPEMFATDAVVQNLGATVRLLFIVRKQDPSTGSVHDEPVASFVVANDLAQALSLKLLQRLPALGDIGKARAAVN